MAGVKRLLLIRKKEVRSDLIDKSGFKQFVKSEAVPVTPMAWSDEQGLSHYGFILEGLMLDDLEALGKWEQLNGSSTVLSFDKIDKKEETVAEVLAKCGLRVNELVKPKAEAVK